MSFQPYIERLRPSRPVFKTWGGALGAAGIVAGGVMTGALTFIAQNANSQSLAFVTSALSLVFALLMLIFVVPPLMRASRREAWMWDLPVGLTLGGFVFVGVTLIVLFAAWMTGNNVLFFVLSVFAAMLIASWMIARASLRDLALAVRLPDYIVAGEVTPVAVTLDNRKWLLPCFSTVIDMRRTREVERTYKVWTWNRNSNNSMEESFTKTRRDKKPLAYFAYLARRSQKQATFNVTFETRGHLRIRGFDVSTRFPLGLLRVRRRLRTRDINLTILPRLDAASESLETAVNANRRERLMPSLQRGESEELYGLRRYVPTDDRRRIAWKATARINRLMVREQVAEVEPRVTVWLDTTLYKSINVNRQQTETDTETSRAMFEHAVSLAASLVMRLVANQAQVRLKLDALETEFADNQRHAFELLLNLALVKPHRPAVSGANDDTDFWRQAATFDYTREPSRYIIVTAAPAAVVPSQVARFAHVVSATTPLSR